MGWRDELYYPVHPAADVFPMQSDEELDALGKDIEKNGLTEPIGLVRLGKLVPVDGMPGATREPMAIIDGRNRLAAMHRVGFDLKSCAVKWTVVNSRGHYPPDFDVAAYVIAKNIRRRHLTKQQQADLIVKAVKA